MPSRGQRLLVFATWADWQPILASLERAREVKYVLSGMLVDKTPPVYESFLVLPGLGRAEMGDSGAERRYLVVRQDSALFSRRILLNTGENRYVTDHENNPDSVIFSPGGVMERPPAVIAGEVAKLSKLDAAEEIFRTFSKLVKKHFTSVKSYWVGSSARSLAARGYRFTSSIGSPMQFDLELKEEAGGHRERPTRRT